MDKIGIVFVSMVFGMLLFSFGQFYVFPCGNSCTMAAQRTIIESDVDRARAFAENILEAIEIRMMNDEAKTDETSETE